ncbi:MAG: hypothetical protein JWQ04_2835 [Pedosphaera sp.]|nr:hypothetical protein [Pedosphaera sp.]
MIFLKRFLLSLAAAIVALAIMRICGVRHPPMWSAYAIGFLCSFAPFKKNHDA